MLSRREKREDAPSVASVCATDGSGSGTSTVTVQTPQYCSSGAESGSLVGDDDVPQSAADFQESPKMMDAPPQRGLDRAFWVDLNKNRAFLSCLAAHGVTSDLKEEIWKDFAAEEKKGMACCARILVKHRRLEGALAYDLWHFFKHRPTTA